MPKIVIVTGDGGESYEALYAVHRFREEEWDVRVAAPSVRRLHLVMHDFEPGWDTYVERPGYGIQVLAAAGLIKDKCVTCYQHVRFEAEQGGATFMSQQAVRDGRIVTAQTWQSHPEFYREIFACLAPNPHATRS